MELMKATMMMTLSEARGLFSSHNYEKATADIPKLRKHFKLIHCEYKFDQIGNEGINILNSTSKSSNLLQYKWYEITLPN